MKNILILIITLIISISLNGQNISGTWQGVLYQGDGTPVNYFRFSMTLNQNGDNINGTSEIIRSNNQNQFAIITLTGSLSDTTFQFQEITIIDEQTDGTFSWCIKNGDLEYDSSQQKLEGNWQAPGCNPGTIEIYRLSVISDTVFCSNELIQLEVTGQNIRWYSDEELTDSLHSGNIYLPSITDTTTFYITQTHYNTESPAIPITVIVNPVPIINNIISSQNGCNVLNGLISVNASGGTGQLEYSIDEINFQLSDSFENLGSGTYSVTIKDNLGCRDLQDNISVISNPLPTTSISGDLEICDGENAILEASGEGGFLWNNGDTINSILVSSSDIYAVTLTDEFGCEAYDSVALIVNPLPNVTLTLPQDTFCIDEMSLEISGGLPIGGSYLEDGVIIDSINPNLLEEGTHLITYTYTDQNGCSDFSSQEIVVENINCTTTSTDEIDIIRKMIIFPNPASAFLKISIDGNELKPKINIYDTTGRIVLSREDCAEEIWIDNLPKGIYFVQLLIDEKEYTEKVIIQ